MRERGVMAIIFFFIGFGNDACISRVRGGNHHTITNPTRAFEGERTLLASSRAPSLVGPNTLTFGHCALSSSTTPSTSGCSGPTTTMSASTRLTNSITVALSMDVVVGSGVVGVVISVIIVMYSVAFHIFPPSARVPPFPGRQMIFPTDGDFDSATARACSRPPFPSRTTVCRRSSSS